MIQLATCRIVGCDWQRRCEDSSAADRVLVEHLVGDHTPRQLAELVLSGWQGRDEGRGIEPDMTDARAAFALEVERSVAATRSAQPARLRSEHRRRDGAPRVEAILMQALRKSRSAHYASLMRRVEQVRPGLSSSAAYMALRRLRDEGLVRQPERGVWELVR